MHKIRVGERLHKVFGQIDFGTLDSGEPSLPFELLVGCQHRDLSLRWEHNFVFMPVAAETCRVMYL